MKVNQRAYYLAVLIFMGMYCSCNTPSYTSVNNMQSQPCTIYFKDGTEKTGKINVRTFDNYSSVTFINFAEGATTNFQRYYAQDIEKLFLNGSIYKVKLLLGSNYWGGGALRFVKLLSKENEQMELYESEVEVKNQQTQKISLLYQLFVQLPGSNHNEVYDLESSRFTPNFDDKMSSFVADCPALAQKIKAKDKEYFFPFVVSNGEQRRKLVLLNIINEYNSCKHQ